MPVSSATSSWTRPCPSGRSATGSTSCWAGLPRRRWRPELGAEPTPSQTVGPYFSLGLLARKANQLVGDGVLLRGRVLDGAGEHVPDAMVEIWQADEEGRYRADFGWGRSGCDEEARFTFVTCKPGPVDGQAPHLTMMVFARGLLKPVLTRVYFPDEEDANRGDPVLSGIDEPQRLVARAVGEHLEFDVHLQGDDETVFFAL